MLHTTDITSPAPAVPLEENYTARRRKMTGVEQHHRAQNLEDTRRVHLAQSVSFRVSRRKGQTPTDSAQIVHVELDRGDTFIVSQSVDVCNFCFLAVSLLLYIVVRTRQNKHLKQTHSKQLQTTRFFQMFVIAGSFFSLIKLRWPKKISLCGLFPFFASLNSSLTTRQREMHLLSS